MYKIFLFTDVCEMLKKGFYKLPEIGKLKIMFNYDENSFDNTVK